MTIKKHRLHQIVEAHYKRLFLKDKIANNLSKEIKLEIFQRGYCHDQLLKSSEYCFEYLKKLVEPFLKESQ